MYGLGACVSGLALYFRGGKTEEGSISLRPKATVYGDSAEGFNRPRQVNLYQLSPDFLNFGSSPRTTLLATASEGERLLILTVSPENTLPTTGIISASCLVWPEGLTLAESTFWSPVSGASNDLTPSTGPTLDRSEHLDRHGNTGHNLPPFLKNSGKNGCS